MPTTYNIVSLLLFLGAIHGFFLTILVLSKRTNKKGNFALAALIFTYSLYLIEAGLFQTPDSPLFPVIVTIGIGMEYLFGPLHYLYVRFVVHSKEKFGLKHTLHFVPFLIIKTYMFYGFFASGLPLDVFTRSASNHFNPVVMQIISFVMLLQGLTYMIFTLFLLKAYSRKIRETFSSIDKINLNWLRNITWITCLIWGIAIVVNIMPVIQGCLTCDSPLLPITLSLTILIYVMGYMGFHQPAILSDVFETNKSEQPKVKYEKTRLETTRLNSYAFSIKTFMENEKPYTNPALTLKDVAGALNMSEHHVSQTINDQFQQNFFNFVNQYRIQDVKSRLTDPTFSHLSIMGIASEAGFNSKSSFNTIFKKHTGLTPSQFKSQIA